MLIPMQVWAERTTELQEFRRATLQMLLQDGSSRWNDH